MPQATVVVNVVGLSRRLLGAHTPHLSSLAREGLARDLQTILPAVTCSVQATLLTGKLPREHGIVANGWYFRDLAQVWLWRQSNHLVSGEKVWETARSRDPGTTCAKIFWWYNMYSSADYSVTPRPIYAADGAKFPEIYSHPAALAERLKVELGDFPFFQFWGPRAGIESSRWIAEAARCIFDWHSPSLLLVYLPHLDYNLQRLGPEDPGIHQDLQAVDAVCGRLVEHVRGAGARVIVLSEYGITPVDGAVHINRTLRQTGFLQVRNERGLEAFDPGASRAFAVADHQVAHVYVADRRDVAEVRKTIEQLSGVDEVLDQGGKQKFGLDHPRSGELVAVSRPDRWFTYYYWLDDRVAPDFARTVDIHRKPGYDPVELFVDPTIRFPAFKVGWSLLKKKLGFRYLMDVIPLDAGLVKGSHGRLTSGPDAPLFISSDPRLLRDRQDETIHATEVKDLILGHLL